MYSVRDGFYPSWIFSGTSSFRVVLSSAPVAAKSPFITLTSKWCDMRCVGWSIWDARAPMRLPACRHFSALSVRPMKSPHSLHLTFGHVSISNVSPGVSPLCIVFQWIIIHSAGGGQYLMFASRQKNLLSVADASRHRQRYSWGRASCSNLSGEKGSEKERDDASPTGTEIVFNFHRSRRRDFRCRFNLAFSNCDRYAYAVKTAEISMTVSQRSK